LQLAAPDTATKHKVRARKIGSFRKDGSRLNGVLPARQALEMVKFHLEWKLALNLESEERFLRDR
jgi:hypothetical protein